MNYIARDDAFELLKKYNKDPFHIQHALTVEAVMKWYANELGYGDDAEYWSIVGLLHDIDLQTLKVLYELLIHSQVLVVWLELLPLSYGKSYLSCDNY